MMDRIVVARLRRLHDGLGAWRKASCDGVRRRIVVGPFAFGAVSLAGHALDAIADIGARVGAYRAFHGAFVIVDEKARWRVGLHPLFYHLEFKRARDRVGGATTYTSLVVD